MNIQTLYHPVKIGSVNISGNLFLAPVAGYSDRSFRSICRKNGASFTYTEMVSAEALVRGSDKTESLMLHSDDEDIFAVQIFGSDEQTMAQATRIVLERASPSVIDINAGCPVPKIVKQGSGSALTRDTERLYVITAAVKKACDEFTFDHPAKTTPVPVTVKIRSGWDSSTLSWKEAAAAAFEAGASAITLHPRTRAQGYEGKADWQLLSDLTSIYNGKIPIFGSGDIFSPEDAKRMIEQTNVDGVMFARGAMGNPFIFNQTRCLLQTGSYESIPPDFRIRTGMIELEMLATDKGENIACREMRKRFCAYTKGIKKGASLRMGIISASTVADYKELFTPFLTDSTLFNDDNLHTDDVHTDSLSTNNL